MAILWALHSRILLSRHGEQVHPCHGPRYRIIVPRWYEHEVQHLVRWKVKSQRRKGAKTCSQFPHFAYLPVSLVLGEPDSSRSLIIARPASVFSYLLGIRLKYPIVIGQVSWNYAMLQRKTIVEFLQQISASNCTPCHIRPYRSRAPSLVLSAKPL